MAGRTGTFLTAATQGRGLAARPLNLTGEKALRQTRSRQRDGSYGAVSILAVLLVAVAVSTLLDAPRARAFPQNLSRDEVPFTSLGQGDMYLADVNTDGLQDFVLSNRVKPGGNSTFTVYLKDNVTSGYKPPVTVPVNGTQVKMVVDNLDGKGLPDVAVLTRAPDLVQVFLQPSGGFSGMKNPNASISTPGAIDLAAGALRWNPWVGHDLAVLYPSGATIFRYIGPSNLYDSVNIQNQTNTSGYQKVTVTDVDGNSKPDMVLANPSELKIFFNNSAGYIDPDCAAYCGVYKISGGLTGDVSVAVANMDSDPSLDIVVAVSNTVVILARVGNPMPWNFTEVFRDTRDGTTQFTIADLNGDGLNDIAIVLNDGRVAFYYQRPGGVFRNLVDMTLDGTEPGTNETITHGDFNGDGYQDIALRSSSSVSFYYQEDTPVRLLRPIPSTCPSNCFYFNQGESGYHLIDLSNYFSDDHGPIGYSIISPRDPNLLASLDGSYLGFTATDGWSGKANFTVAANDGYLWHTPTATNLTVMVNARPVIASTPSAQISIGDEYLYQPIVTDAYPSGDYQTFALLAGPSGMSIDYNSGAIRWRPSSLGNFTVSIQATDSLGAASPVQTFTFRVVQRPEQPPTTPFGLPIPRDATGIIVVGAIFATLVLLAAMIAISENVKYGLLLALIPLYSKIKREKVLDHFIRGQIFGYIMANPGEHYNSIKLALDITNGSLAHHLRTLEREQFVKSKRFGLYRRFYPWAMRVPEDGYFQLNEIQKNVLDLCRHQPGVSQKELAASLNLTPPTINYHIAILAEHGHVSVIRRGRKTHVYLLKGANDEAHGQVPH